MTCSSPRVSSIFSESVMSLSVPLMFLRVPSLPLLCLSSTRVSCSSVSYTVKVRCFHVWYASPVTSCLFMSAVFPVCSHFLIILRCFYVSFSLGPVLRSPLFLCISLCASLCPLFIYISSLVCISFGLAIKLCLSYFCLRESAFGTFPACCTAKFMTQRPKTLQTLHTSTQRNFQVHIGL